MRPFSLSSAPATEDAVDRGGSGAAFLAGGTKLVDLMKLGGAETRERVVDIDAAAARRHRGARGRRCASAPWRATATVADARRRARSATRCSPRHCSPAPRRSFATWPPSAATSCSAPAAPTSGTSARRCNKREPGAGCAAMEGYNRMHAILGTSEKCIATHPSDMCVALAALEAVVRVRGPRGERELPVADLHLLPGEQAGARDRPRAGRADHRRSGSPRPARGALALRQGARPASLRVRAHLCAAAVQVRRRPRRRCALRARRRGDQAVARPGGGGVAARAAAHARVVRPRRRRWRCAARVLGATTPSRSSWRSERSCAP